MKEGKKEDLELEKLFIRVCHKALTITYDRGEYGRARERILFNLKQCNNETRFRSFIADFLANTGPIEILEENYDTLFALVLNDWQLFKDLFHLAMASCPKPKTKEANAIIEE